MKKTRVVNKTRFMIFLLISISLLITCITISINTIYSYGANNRPYYQNYTVEPNDTVWNIAIETKPDNTDIREHVRNIIRENKLESSKIKPGDTIVIPKF